MSIDQIVSEALRLPPRERALLAESLWESLETPFEAPHQMDDIAAIERANLRERQITAGEVPPLTHEEMMASLRKC